MEHIQRTIEEIENKIVAHEREIRKYRATINSLCEIAGLPQKYDLDDDTPSGAGDTLTNARRGVRPDQFYGKPLATAVREALNVLRAAGRAPANVETIYDLLSEGGYNFDSRGREAGIQGLSVSIGKNSALFVKLKNGLIGVTDWYESAPRARRKKRVGDESSGEEAASEGESSSGGDDEADQTGADQPSQEQTEPNDSGAQRA